MNLKLALPNGRTLKVKARFPYEESPVGYRALIRDGGDGKTAIVVSMAEEGEEIDLEFPDEKPITTHRHISSVIETAERYAVMPWQLLFDLLPAVFNWYEEELIVVAKEDWSFLDKKSLEVLQYVKKKKGVREEKLESKSDRAIVQKLLSLGFLKRAKEWKMPELSIRLYSLAVPVEKAIEKLKAFRNREEKLRLVYYLQERRYASREELKEAGFSAESLRALIKKGIVMEAEDSLQEVRRPQSLRQEIENSLKPLGKKTVIFGSWEGILSRLEEVFDKLLSEEKSAFVFCHSSQLVDTLWKELYPFFGDRLLRLSSKEKQRDFIQRWFSLHGDKGVIVIGSRIALLAPFKNLDLVVSFGKKERTPYESVDLEHYLYLLSMLYGADYMVASLTLPLNLYLNQDWHKEYYPPSSEIVPIKRKGNEVLSPELISRIDKEKECLFLVNKTGYAYGFCAFCGWIAECPTCGKFLTLSKDKQRAFCTSCGYKSDAVCPECGRALQELGFGIEKAVEEVNRIFGVREHFHFDTVPRPGRSYEQVVVLHADNILSVPWYDSLENYFSYLWNALCISRKSLIVQTALERNPTLEHIKNKDWKSFCKEELKRREEEELPPFKRLIVAKVRSLPKLKNIPMEVSKRSQGDSLELLIKVDERYMPELLKELRKIQPTKLEVL